jgi:hypothetical protein
MRGKKLIALCVILIFGVSALTFAQRRRGRSGYYGLKRPSADSFRGDFTFCRIAFRESPYGDGGGWGVDYPRADQNLPIRLAELTKTPVNFEAPGEPHHVVITLIEPELFKCPFIMMTEVGSIYLDPDEAKNLRAYLQKGGFLWADDFWGEYAWEHWEDEIRKVLPAAQYPLIDVPLTHPVFKTLFEIKRFPQIPSIYGGRYFGGTSERPDAPHANARAIVDDKGRVMVFISHNTDFGDSYEREADDPTYFYNFSVEGYAVGINVLLYAMTH